MGINFYEDNDYKNAEHWLELALRNKYTSLKKRNKNIFKRK